VENNQGKKRKLRESHAIPNTPEVKERIELATTTSGWPKYVIRELMNIGGLSPDLSDADDKYVINFLPKIIRNKEVLGFLMSKVGGIEAQHTWVDNHKEGPSFESFVHRKIEELYSQGKTVNVKKMMVFLRNYGGIHASKAECYSDRELRKIITKIRNKVNVEHWRKAQANKDVIKKHMVKAQYLRRKLIDLKKQVNLYEDNDLTWVNSQKTPALTNALDDLGTRYPSLITEQSYNLRELSRNIFAQIQNQCQMRSDESEAEYAIRFGEWLEGEYKGGDFYKINKYADLSDDLAATIEGDKISFLSKIFNKQWSVLEIARKHNLPIKSIQLESTLETLENKLYQVLNYYSAAAYHAKALEIRKLIPSLVDQSTEVDQYIQWSESVWDALGDPPF
jgi:hypothetical protein